MKMYLENISLWFQSTEALIRLNSYRHMGNGSFWVQVVLLQILDRGTNTVFGGDPAMTISGRVYRDRRNNVVAGSLNWLANRLFHPEGSGDRHWGWAGEGSTNDRNLPNPQQGIAIAFGTVIYWSLLSSLIRMDFDWSLPMLAWKVLSLIL